MICGTYALPSDEVVGAELQAATILRTGIQVYQTPASGDYDAWAKNSKAAESEKKFVKKISEKLVSSVIHRIIPKLKAAYN